MCACAGFTFYFVFSYPLQPHILVLFSFYHLFLLYHGVVIENIHRLPLSQFQEGGDGGYGYKKGENM